MGGDDDTGHEVGIRRLMKLVRWGVSIWVCVIYETLGRWDRVHLRKQVDVATQWRLVNFYTKDCEEEFGVRAREQGLW